MSDSHGREATDLSRRAFLEGTSAALVIATTAPTAAGQTPAAQAAPVPKTPISVTVNGAVQQDRGRGPWTLAELLRDQLKLTGTKLGCERGECGACTVLLDDKPVYACSQLAVWADGRTVLTVEGLARNGRLHPLQQAFIEHDAPQCGFCTSGQLMSAKALLDRNSASDAAGRQGGARRHPLPLRELQPLRRGDRRRRRRPDLAVQSAADGRCGVSQQNDSRRGLAPLKTLGHPTPRIDAVERVTGAATGTPAMSCCPACCSRASCAARIRMRASGRSTCRRRRRCRA